jgi:isoquinoline 1-oxidoreductase beta subunit
MPKITRRGLLIGAGLVGGGLLLGTIGIATYVGAFDQRAKQSEVLGKKMVMQWITIEPDGEVILHGPHTEMGQGTQTSLLQILLDEMDCDPATTRYQLAPADPAFTLSDMLEGMLAEMGGVELDGSWSSHFIRQALGRVAELGGAQFTGGSLSVRFTGWVGVRRAGALARMMLAQAGADAMGVPLSEVRTENSRVHHDKSGKSMGYGELADAAAMLEIPDEPVFKDATDYKFVGKPFDRFDIPEKVFGEPVYGMDFEVPGMRYAAVAPAPLSQGTITGVSNEAEIKKRRGVEAVVVLDEAVAVVADNPWRAEQAVRALEIECLPPEGGLLDHEALEAERLAAVQAGGDEVISRGDGVETLSGDVVEATYVTPFYVHVPMEPLNATVWEEGGKHHVATGAQGGLGTRTVAAEALERDFDDVVLHMRTMGGGFGRRNDLVPDAVNWVRQACQIQRQVGGAVKMIWSREAGVQMSMYHPADAARMRATLGADGKPDAWLADVYAALLPSDEVMPPYEIPNVTVRSVGADPSLPYGYWRSVLAFTAVHFIESFVDELAAKAGKDPLEYRLSMLSGRARKVVARAAEMANWKGTKVGDKAYGIAFTHSFGSMSAAVLEVSRVNGKPKVHRAWCAIDCGLPVNPGSVEAQAQGGLYWGISAALFGKIEFDEGRMRQSNFHDYRVATFGQAPKIEVDVMRDPDAPIGGVGELTAPLVAPALSSALAVLGDRQRSLPLT